MKPWLMAVSRFEDWQFIFHLGISQWDVE